MALKEGNRFFKPSLAQYTPQFVEEESLFPQMLAIGERDQQKGDQVIGELGQMDIYLQVNADRSQQKLRGKVLKGYYDRVDDLTKQIIEGANPDQIYGSLTAISRDWQVDPTRAMLERSYSQAQASDKAVQEAKSKNIYDPRYDEMKRLRAANLSGDETELIFSGLRTYVDPLDDAQQLIKDIASSGSFTDVFDVGESSGQIIGIKDSWEGVTSDKVAELVKVTAPLFLKTQGGKQLIDDILTANPEATREDIFAGAEDYLYRAASPQIGVETEIGRDLSFVPEHITKQSTIAPLPTGKTYLTENPLALDPVEMDVNYNAEGMWEKPTYEKPSGISYDVHEKNTQGKTDSFVAGLKRVQEWESAFVPRNVETRMAQAEKAAKKRYGKDWNEWMTAREYTEGIRRDFPSLEPLSDKDVMTAYTNAMSKHRSIEDTNLELPYSLSKEFTRQMLGDKEAKELIEANNFAGKDIYVSDDKGITLSGGLAEVVEELGFKWKDKKGKIKQGHQNDFQALLNDARIVRIGVHPKEEAVFYMSMRDSEGRDRLVAIEANEPMKKSFHDPFSIYQMIMQGKPGQHNSADKMENKESLYTYDVIMDINPNQQEIQRQIIRTNNSTGKQFRINLDDLYNYAWIDYENKYIKPRE